MDKQTQYKIRQRESINIFRCEKEKYIHNLIREANQDYAEQNTRNLYRKIIILSKNYKQPEKFLRNEEGTLITSDEELAEKWVKYFSDLLNCTEPVNQFPLDDIQRNIAMWPAPTKDEVVRQLKQLKNNRDPGENEISPRTVKKQWTWTNGTYSFTDKGDLEKGGNIWGLQNYNHISYI